MTITLELSSEMQRRLERAAEAVGVRPDEFVLQVLDDRLDSAETAEGVAIQRDAIRPDTPRPLTTNDLAHLMAIRTRSVDQTELPVGFDPDLYPLF